MSSRLRFSSTLLLAVLALAGCSASTGTADTNPSTEQSSAPVKSPAAAQTPLERFTADLTSQLGDLNRDGKRLTLVDYDSSSKELMVKFALNDNFTNHLIVVGCWKDFADTISAVRSSGLAVETLYVFGSLPFLDEMGNPTGEKDVVGATFEKKALLKANLDNLPGEMLKSAAADWWVNPQLEG